MADDDFFNNLFSDASFLPPGARSFQMEDFDDRARLAYAFLTMPGINQEVTILSDTSYGMQTYRETSVPPLEDFIATFEKSGGTAFGIASFDSEDTRRYGIFIAPGATPVLNIYCPASAEEVSSVMGDLAERYDDLMDLKENPDEPLF